MRTLLLVLGMFATPPLLAGEPGDIAGDQARALAATCSGCHSLAAGSAKADTPALTQLSKAELASQLLAFKAGSRAGTIMGRIARGYTQQELQAIAEVLGQP